MKNKIKKITPFIISFFILFFLFHKIKIDNFYSLFKNINLNIFIVATVALFVAVPSLSALRWKIVLEKLNCKIDFRESFKIYMASLPLSKISPANSGDLIRAYYLKEKIKPSISAGGIIFERMMDFFALAIITLAFGIVSENKHAIFTGILLGVTIIILFALGNKIKLNKIKNFFQIFKTISKYPKTFFIIFIYTLLLWFVIIIYIKLIFLALGTNIENIILFAIHPLVVFLSILPISVSGIGVRESAMVYLYSGLASEQIILITGLIYSLFGGIILPILGTPFLYKQLKKNKKL